MHCGAVCITTPNSCALPSRWKSDQQYGGSSQGAAPHQSTAHTPPAFVDREQVRASEQPTVLQQASLPAAAAYLPAAAAAFHLLPVMPAGRHSPIPPRQHPSGLTKSSGAARFWFHTSNRSWPGSAVTGSALRKGSRSVALFGLAWQRCCTLMSRAAVAAGDAYQQPSIAFPPPLWRTHRVSSCHVGLVPPCRQSG